MSETRLLKIETKLDSMESKVDRIHTLLVGIDGVNESGFIGRIEKRMGSLESFRNRFLLGVAAIGVPSAGAGTAWYSGFFKYFSGTQ